MLTKIARFSQSSRQSWMTCIKARSTLNSNVLMQYSAKIDVKLVKQLRGETDAPLGQCKKALLATNSNLDEAKVWLQKQGLATAKKKSSRETTEGFLGFSHNDNQASLMEVNCETDFSAGTKSFKTLVSTLSKHLNEGTYDSMEKFLDSTVTDGQKVSDMLIETTQKIGENVSIGRFSQFHAKTGKFYGYIHNNVSENVGELVTLVELDGEASEGFGVQLAMHAAAMQPLYVRESDIPDEKMETYKEIVAEQSSNLKDKPNYEKIIAGKLRKQLQDDVLMYQKWIHDDKTPVEKILAQNNTSLVQIVRWKSGEDHTKRVKLSFEEEVKQQLGQL